MWTWLRRRRRARLFSRPFPEAWDAILRRNVLPVRALGGEELARLRRAVLVLVTEKDWEGCGGLELTDEVRVTIAGFAGLMVLGFDDFYFDSLETVLVYPGGFIVQRELEAEPEHLLGEAHHGGPVVLSWWGEGAGPDRMERVAEVVLHELAHLLDMFDGEPDGVPAIFDAAGRQRWRAVMEEEFARHVEDARLEAPTVIPSIGAENRGEFFAVATECFFLEPRALREERPRLYDLLAEWYRQDPAARALDGGDGDAAPGSLPGGGPTPRRGDADEDADAAADAQDERELRELDAAIRAHPEFADGHRQRGWIFIDREEYERAIDEFTAVLRLVPDDDEALHGRAEALHCLGEHERAIADLDRAIEINSVDAASFLLRGRCHRARGELKKALADLNAAVRRDREDPDARCERGETRIELGEPAKAIEDLVEAIRLDPEFAGAYRARARALHALGRKKEARRDDRRAKELEEDSREAL